MKREHEKEVKRGVRESLCRELKEKNYEKQRTGGFTIKTVS